MYICVSSELQVQSSFCIQAWIINCICNIRDGVKKNLTNQVKPDKSKPGSGHHFRSTVARYSEGQSVVAPLENHPFPVKIPKISSSPLRMGQLSDSSVNRMKKGPKTPSTDPSSITSLSDSHIGNPKIPSFHSVIQSVIKSQASKTSSTNSNPKLNTGSSHQRMKRATKKKGKSGKPIRGILKK